MSIGHIQTLVEVTCKTNAQFRLIFQKYACSMHEGPQNVEEGISPSLTTWKGTPVWNQFQKWKLQCWTRQSGGNLSARLGRFAQFPAWKLILKLSPVQRQFSLHLSVLCACAYKYSSLVVALEISAQQLVDLLPHFLQNWLNYASSATWEKVLKNAHLAKLCQKKVLAQSGRTYL